MSEETTLEEFIEENISRGLCSSEIAFYELCRTDQGEVWLEEEDDTEHVNTEYDNFKCAVCEEEIGTEDDDVFNHIREKHPEVTGLPPLEESPDEFEDI